jgi:hypothetical protein
MEELPLAWGGREEKLIILKERLPTMSKLVIRNLKWHYTRLWRNKMMPGKITN